MKFNRWLKFSSIGLKATISARVSGADVKHQIIKSFLSQPGLPAKFAQLMAMKNGIEIQKNTLPKLTLEEVRSRIESLQPQLAQDLETINELPATASLSQVHQGLLKSGQRIAIKVQFPGLADEVQAQIDDIMALAARSPARAYGFSEETWGQFLKEKLLNELDYKKEAENQRKFRNELDGRKIVVPEVLSEYSCQQILVQSWEPSTPFVELKENNSSQAAEQLLEFLVKSLFQIKMIHCDMNPENYGYRLCNKTSATKLVVYDFGAIETLSAPRVESVSRLIARSRGLIDDDWILLLEALGFDPEKLTPLAKKLDFIMKELLQPFAARGPWDPRQWRPGLAINKIAGPDKWWLRTAGPAWFLYLMRSIQGWHHGMSLTHEKISTGDIIEQYLNDYTLNNDYALKKHGTEKSPKILRAPIWISEQANKSSAAYLRVVVATPTEVIVEIQLPAAAIINLPDLVPESVSSKITARGIDLKTLGSDLAAKGAPCGPVFDLHEDGRHYRVWLE